MLHYISIKTLFPHRRHKLYNTNNNVINSFFFNYHFNLRIQRISLIVVDGRARPTIINN